MGRGSSPLLVCMEISLFAVCEYNWVLNILQVQCLIFVIEKRTKFFFKFNTSPAFFKLFTLDKRLEIIPRLLAPPNDCNFEGTIGWEMNQSQLKNPLAICRETLAVQFNTSTCCPFHVAGDRRSIHPIRSFTTFGGLLLFLSSEGSGIILNLINTIIWLSSQVL